MADVGPSHSSCADWCLGLPPSSRISSRNSPGPTTQTAAVSRRRRSILPPHRPVMIASAIATDKPEDTRNTERELSESESIEVIDHSCITPNLEFCCFFDAIENEVEAFELLRNIRPEGREESNKEVEPQPQQQQQQHRDVRSSSPRNSPPPSSTIETVYYSSPDSVMKWGVSARDDSDKPWKKDHVDTDSVANILGALSFETEPPTERNDVEEDELVAIPEGESHDETATCGSDNTKNNILISDQGKEAVRLSQPHEHDDPTETTFDTTEHTGTTKELEDEDHDHEVVTETSRTTVATTPELAFLPPPITSTPVKEQIKHFTEPVVSPTTTKKQRDMPELSVPVRAISEDYESGRLLLSSVSSHSMDRTADIEFEEVQAKIETVELTEQQVAAREAELERVAAVGREKAAQLHYEALEGKRRAAAAVAAAAERERLQKEKEEEDRLLKMQFKEEQHRILQQQRDEEMLLKQQQELETARALQQPNEEGKPKQESATDSLLRELKEEEQALKQSIFKQVHGLQEEPASQERGLLEDQLLLQQHEEEEQLSTPHNDKFQLEEWQSQLEQDQHEESSTPLPETERVDALELSPEANEHVTRDLVVQEAAIDDVIHSSNEKEEEYDEETIYEEEIVEYYEEEVLDDVDDDVLATPADVVSFELEGMQSDLVSNFSNESVTNMALASTDTLNIVTELIQQGLWSKDEKVVLAAMGEIAHKAGSEVTYRLDIARAGGILAIVRSMEKHAGVADIQIVACKALEKLALDTENELVIGEVGGVEAILSAMMAHFSMSNVQEAAWSALWNCTCGNACDSMTIDAEGGMRAIVSCMKKHISNAEVQKSACGTLTNLCLENEKRLTALANADGFSAIANAMQKHWSNAEVRNEASHAMHILLERNSMLHIEGEAVTEEIDEVVIHDGEDAADYAEEEIVE